MINHQNGTICPISDISSLFKNNVNKLSKECVYIVRNKLLSKHLELLFVNKQQNWPSATWTAVLQMLLSRSLLEIRGLTHHVHDPPFTSEHPHRRRSHRNSFTEAHGLADYPPSLPLLFLALGIKSTCAKNITKEMKSPLFTSYYIKVIHSERFIECLLCRSGIIYPYYMTDFQYQVFISSTVLQNML